MLFVVCSRVYLRTLSELRLDGSNFHRPKPLLLLAYLAIEGPKTRSHLADMFWIDAQDARDSLSTTIRRLNRAAASVLQVNGERVEACVRCDVVEYEAAIRAQRFTRSLELYPGPFLDGVNVGLLEEGEEWLFGTRERLANSARRANFEVARAALHRGDVAIALDHAESALDVHGAPPWDREDLDELYSMLARLGSPRTLDVKREADQLGLAFEPSAERSRHMDRNRSNLPHVATTFVGRVRELDQIRDVLDAERVRLVTLHGPGGVGKSRLAIEAAHVAIDEGHFPDGACFVGLETVSDADSMSTAIAGALQLAHAPHVRMERHIVASIGEKRILLVLDNFEHLVARTNFPEVMLTECPNVALLVTSRRTLNVRAEHVLRVHGLSTSSSASRSDAVRLLHERIAQRSPERVSSNAHMGLDRRVCELLHGNPLGIELAAALTRVLPLSEIAEELESGLHVLVDQDPSAPARRKSLRGALEISWDLLDRDEQDASAATSVFRGGFHRRAAQHVAGVHLAVLTSLVDAALVSPLPSGRFEQHPLVHQFMADSLAERPGLEQSVRERHSRYYLACLASMDHDLHGGATSASVIDWIDQEFANLQQAWAWAVAHLEEDLLENAAWPIAHYAEFRGRYSDVHQLFKAAIESLRDHGDVTSESSAEGHILACSAFLSFRLGRIHEAVEQGTTAIEILEPMRRTSGNWGLWSARQALAMSFLTTSEPDRAREQLRVSMEQCFHDEAHAGGDERLQRIADYSVSVSREALAALDLHAGDFDGAVAQLRAAQERMEPHQCPSLGYLYWTLGQTYAAMGRIDDAHAALEKALAFSYATGFEMLVGHILNDLARVHLSLGDAWRAEEIAGDALSVASESGDKWLETSALAAHGMAAAAAGRADAAMDRFERSLRVAESFQGHRFAFDALRGVADLCWVAGDAKASIQLLAYIRCTPLAPKAIAYAAGQQLRALRSDFSKHEFEAWVSEGETMQVEKVFSLPASTTNR